MKRSGAFMVAVATVVGAACADGDAGRQWGDVSDSSRPVVANAVELAGTDDYRLLLGDDPSADAAEEARCIQLVIGDVGTWCSPVDPADPDEGTARTTQMLRGPDGQRIIWFQTRYPVDSDDEIDHFVVWSSADPDGRRIDPIRESTALHMVWSMQPDEAPWGMQMIAADGSLLFADSVVGLSAD